MDLHSDILQREGMHSTYSTFSSAGEISTTLAGAHSMAQPVMPTQALFAFQSLASSSAMQPHSLSYLLPPSAQLTTDCTASILASGSGMMSSVVNNPLQTTVTSIVQSGITGMTRPAVTVSGTSSAYAYSNRVSNLMLHLTVFWFVCDCIVCFSHK